MTDTDTQAGLLPDADDIAGVVRGIRHALNKLEYKQTGRFAKVNGYAFAEIPDWQLKQWLEALTRQAEAPEGWKLVPEVSSVEMRLAAFRSPWWGSNNIDAAKNVWTAMLAAAPQKQGA